MATTDTTVSNLIINKLTKAQYDTITTPSETELYLVPDEVDSTPTNGSDNYVTSGGVYSALSGKQDSLVSGTNIKTINNNSIVGSGNLELALGDNNVQSDWNQTSTTADDFIKNKPSIPTKVSDLTNDSGYITSYTETDPVFTASAAHGISSSDITNWNAKGTYSKPSGGIPDTDLSSAVQTSLGKADTALQSFTESDPVFTASAAYGISSSDITNWNGKTSNVGTITGINMNGASKGTSGVVDLGTVITAHQDISGKVGSTDVTTIVKMTQNAYDALASVDSNTLYLIVES